jgi:hypothetical protein
MTSLSKRKAFLVRPMGAVAAAAVLTILAPDAEAQEVQITGPLKDAPAGRHMRLHREGRVDLAAHATFTLLDEYRRGIMPGLRFNYHFLDWLGIGVFGGPVFTYNTGLSEELQDKAIDDRSCEENPESLACKRTAVSLCRGSGDCLADNQLGHMVWYVAPQLTVIPFRGKLSLFGAAFLDSDISLFIGPAIIGLDERAECEAGNCAEGDSFTLEHRVTATATFGLGFNFYPVWTEKDGSQASWVGFGAEFRGTPFEWNTSGFDNGGSAGPGQEGEGEFPDDAIDGHDRTLHFNPMLSVFVSFQLPPKIEISD